MHTGTLRTVVTIGIAWACLADAAENVAAVCAAPDGHVACYHDGQLAWVFAGPAPQAPELQPLGAGRTLVDDSVVLGANGRVLLRRALPADRRLAGREDGGPEWQPLMQLYPAPGTGESNETYGPVFDSAGNAWILNVHYAAGGQRVEALRSNGHTGTWEPAELLLQTTNYIGRAGITITPADEVVVMFRRLSGGTNLIQVARRLPGTGWTTPETAYSGPFFQAPEVAADAGGNLMVSFDGPPNNTSMYTAIYDAAAGTWSPAARLSPAACTAQLPTLVQNRSGSAVYAVYRISSGASAPGLYVHRFDSLTKSWGSGIHLELSDAASFPGGMGPFSRMLGTADAAGDATVCYHVYDSEVEGYAVQANRTSGGVWQPVEQLMPPNPDPADLQNFGDADTSPTGHAFIAFQRHDAQTTGVNSIWTICYDAASGSWQPAAAAYADYSTLVTRARIAFRGASHAVATFRGVVGGSYQVASALFDGANWSTQLLDVPGTYEAFVQETATDGGDVVLFFTGEGGPFGPTYGVFSTWLPADLADMNCDGAVDFDDVDPFVLALSDPADYHTQFPGCDYLNADCDQDGDVDFHDISAFVALLGR